MSLTLTFSGNESLLTADYFPPLELNTNYVCGLVDIQTFNSIPNVDKENNQFHIGNHTLEIPVGSYEIDDIERFIQNTLKDSAIVVVIKANKNTLKSEVKASEPVYFNRDRSIGSLLGFSNKQLEPHTLYASDLPVNINKVNAIRVECSIISGSYINGRQVHTIHEFAPTVPPGYKIVEVPSNVIYLPVNVRQIGSITLKIVDQDGDPVNFRGENITVRLHLKPQNDSV